MAPSPCSLAAALLPLFSRSRALFTVSGCAPVAIGSGALSLSASASCPRSHLGLLPSFPPRPISPVRTCHRSPGPLAVYSPSLTHLFPLARPAVSVLPATRRLWPSIRTDHARTRACSPSARLAGLTPVLARPLAPRPQRARACRSSRACLAHTHPPVQAPLLLLCPCLRSPMFGHPHPHSLTRFRLPRPRSTDS